MVKLDIGCGKNKREGFTGVDQYPMPGVDIVHDVRQTWPWDSDSVDEVHCSHFAEHLTATERFHFFNELHRVLKHGAKATIVVPYWRSSRAYGDPTHQWPPFVEMSWWYLNRAWRKVNAPHDDEEWNPIGFNCDFDSTYGYALAPSIATRNQDFQQFALAYYCEAAQDMVATLTKRE